MTDADLIQGSEDWQKARVGGLGASRLSEVLAKTKTGWGAGRANVMADLIAERLTNVPAPAFVSDAMRWGTETEPQARIAYEFYRNADVTQIGLVRHPKINRSHASPDGLVSDDGLIEMKCPNTATHIDTLLGRSVPGKYITQIQWQLACTGRKWCDFVSFDPRLPESMQLFVRRVERNDLAIRELELQVTDFLEEVDEKVKQLVAIYEREAA